MELRLISNNVEIEVKLVAKITSDELFDKAMATDITKEEEDRTSAMMNILDKGNGSSKDKLYLVLNVIRLGKNYDNTLGRKITKEEYWENDISEPIGSVFIKTDSRNTVIEIYEKREMNNYDNEYAILRI